MKKIARPVIVCALLAAVLPVHAWDKYDRVIASVNGDAIIESEIDLRFSQAAAMSKIPEARKQQEKSRILDVFIENLLVEQTAIENSIIVRDKKVLEHIKKMMAPFFAPSVKNEDLNSAVEEVSRRLEERIASKETGREPKALPADRRHIDTRLNSFISYIEKNQKISFDLFFEDIKIQMAREQVMSIAIGITPPSEEDAKSWYDKNKSQLGFEVNVKHILVKPEGAGLTAERDANKTISSLRSRIVKGESFEKLAKSFSDDPGSAAEGGSLGWMPLQELDPYFANQVWQMKKSGSISQVFKSSYGYHIVKYLGRRPVSFDRAKQMIMYKIYNDRVMEQFQKWVGKKKKSSDIKIFLDGYTALNK